MKLAPNMIVSLHISRESFVLKHPLVSTDISVSSTDISRNFYDQDFSFFFSFPCKVHFHHTAMFQKMYSN